MASRPKQIEAHVKWLRQNLKEQIEAMDKRMYEFKLLSYIVDGQRFRALSPTVSPWLATNRVKLEVTVKSFKDTLPLLEKLADWGYDFSKSEDQPTYGVRRYISDRIVIEAELQEGDESCRRVVIGYEKLSEPRPIYGFECGDPQDLPAANPNPATPVEFDSDETTSA